MLTCMCRPFKYRVKGFGIFVELGFMGPRHAMISFIATLRSLSILIILYVLLNLLSYVQDIAIV